MLILNGSQLLIVRLFICVCCCVFKNFLSVVLLSEQPGRWNVNFFLYASPLECECTGHLACSYLDEVWSSLKATLKPLFTRLLFECVSQYFVRLSVHPCSSDVASNRSKWKCSVLEGIQQWRGLASTTLKQKNKKERKVDLKKKNNGVKCFNSFPSYTSSMILYLCVYKDSSKLEKCSKTLSNYFIQHLSSSVPPFSNQSCILAVHTVNHSAPASWLTAPQGRTYWLPWWPAWCRADSHTTLTDSHTRCLAWSFFCLSTTRIHKRPI